MNHAYNPISQKAEARRPLQVWGQPWLHTEFEARLSIKTNTQNRRRAETVCSPETEYVSSIFKAQS